MRSSLVILLAVVSLLALGFGLAWRSASQAATLADQEAARTAEVVAGLSRELNDLRRRFAGIDPEAMRFPAD